MRQDTMRWVASFVREVLFRLRVLTGTWRGFAIHADRDGKLQNAFRLDGLRIDTETDDEIRIVRNGVTVFGVAVKEE